MTSLRVLRVRLARGTSSEYSFTVSRFLDLHLMYFLVYSVFSNLTNSKFYSRKRMKIFMKNANLILKLDFEWISSVFLEFDWSTPSNRKCTDIEPEVANDPIKLLAILNTKIRARKNKRWFLTKGSHLKFDNSVKMTKRRWVVRVSVTPLFSQQ